MLANIMSNTSNTVSAAMNKVYNFMFLGILWTALVAYGVASTPQLQMMVLTNPLKWVIILAPLVCLLFMSFKFDKLSTGTIAVLFGVVTTLFGASLSTIFLAYTGGEIASALFSSSVIFLVMSVYGYTTKKDLSSFGQYLFIALIGLILASVVNLFIGSSLMTMGLSALAVIIFTIFVAYDTQNIKRIMASAHLGNENKLAILGALNLYLDFINLFVNLLQLMGGSRK